MALLASAQRLSQPKIGGQCLGFETATAPPFCTAVISGKAPVCTVPPKARRSRGSRLKQIDQRARTAYNYQVAPTTDLDYWGGPSRPNVRGGETIGGSAFALGTAK
jgi:hypothetical protein